jgi:hypothetical protein
LQYFKFFYSADRKFTPTLPRIGDRDIEKDEGISDEEDTAELKLQLELNEQVRKKFSKKIHILFLLNF